tara:strand:+ start:1662 stop:1859 length:198 start_codon:yes stop_codon:yes gene_type:complete
MGRSVKVDGSKPGNGPKAVEFAQIDKQGRVPYGKTADVKIPGALKKMKARGMGAAVKGGDYMGYE